MLSCKSNVIIYPFFVTSILKMVLRCFLFLTFLILLNASAVASQRVSHDDRHLSSFYPKNAVLGVTLCQSIIKVKYFEDFFDPTHPLSLIGPLFSIRKNIGRNGLRITINYLGADRICVIGDRTPIHYNTIFILQGGNITFSGFVFFDASGLVVSKNADGMTLVENFFQNRDSVGIVVEVNTKNILIEKNIFSQTRGINILAMSPPPENWEDRAVGNLIIRSNIFYSIDRLLPNGGEPIILGVAYFNSKQRWMGAIVERNLFYRANGDIELISIKSHGNVIRDNFGFNNNAHITIRMGDFNVIKNNWMYSRNHPICIRVIGRFNRVTNNTFACNRTAITLSDQFRDPDAMRAKTRRLQDDSSVAYDASVQNFFYGNKFLGASYLVGFVNWNSPIWESARENLIFNNCFFVRLFQGIEDRNVRRRVPSSRLYNNIVLWSKNSRRSFFENVFDYQQLMMLYC